MKKLVIFLAALFLLAACSSVKKVKEEEANIEKLTKLSQNVDILQENIDASIIEFNKTKSIAAVVEESIVKFKASDAEFRTELEQLNKITDFYKVKLFFEKSGVVFKRHMDKFTIVMPSDILFDYNKYNLKSDFNDVIDAVAEAIKMAPKLNISIIGHTDNTGSSKYNYSLSKKRAQTVADYLVEKGVVRERLIVIGKGFDEPIATNKTEEGRQLNRRVEINIVN